MTSDVNRIKQYNIHHNIFWYDVYLTKYVYNVKVLRPLKPDRSTFSDWKAYLCYKGAA
jgi:hypothetical protein